MQKDILHFSHANGFPSQSYKVMLNVLSEHYDVRWVDKMAHHPDYPVTDNWPHLMDELIHYFESNYDRPVIAVGHSLGGVLSFMVAKARPDLVKQVILLDAPVLDRLGSVVVRLAKTLGFVDYITPAGRTEGRQDRWDNTEQALEYFKGKSLFKKVDDRCLKDYIRYGTEPYDNGIRLTFCAHTEVKIYRTLPHNLHKKSKELKIPSAMIYGTDSNVVMPMQLTYMKNKVGMYIDKLTGSHLYPLECPEKSAEKIHQVIEHLSKW
jgi:pimeloyl-ACP methyl ester carboxylesterase